MFTIYALTDPRDTTIRYIGLTNDMYARFKRHMRADSGNSTKDTWLRELQEAGYIAGMQCIEQVEEITQAYEREIYWIRHYLGMSAPLTNIASNPEVSRNSLLTLVKDEAVIYPMTGCCKLCGKELEEKPGGHRVKEYCNDAHRVKYWRQQHQQDQNTALLAELEQLRTQVTNQTQEVKRLKDNEAALEQQNTELAEVNAKLVEKLTAEIWFLQDEQPRKFLAYLREKPLGPLGPKILSDSNMKEKDTRAHYQYNMGLKKSQYNQKDIERFRELWIMLLKEPYGKY